MDLDLSKVFTYIKDSGTGAKDFLKSKKDLLVEDAKKTFSIEGMLGKKKVDPVTGQETGGREGGWLDELSITPHNTAEMWANLDVSEKRRAIQAIKSPHYSGNFQKILDEIKERTY